MFDKRNFLLRSLIQLSLIGVLIAKASAFNKHKSSFSVEDVINSVESIQRKLKYEKKSSEGFFNDEQCAKQLRLFADALDEREDWAARSKLK